MFNAEIWDAYELCMECNWERLACVPDEVITDGVVDEKLGTTKKFFRLGFMSFVDLWYVVLEPEFIDDEVMGEGTWVVYAMGEILFRCESGDDEWFEGDVTKLLLSIKEGMTPLVLSVKPKNSQKIFNEYMWNG